MKISFFTIVVVLLLTTACNNAEQPQAKVEPTSSDSLTYYYNLYVKKVDSIVKLRRSVSPVPAHPLDEKIGQLYIDAFRRQFPSDATHILKFDKMTISFYAKYMLDNKIDTLAFSFAKYDTTGFGSLRDPIYESRAGKMRGRWTMVVGEFEKGKKEKPFMIPGLDYRFYDDWSQEWP